MASASLLLQLSSCNIPSSILDLTPMDRLDDLKRQNISTSPTIIENLSEFREVHQTLNFWLYDNLMQCRRCTNNGPNEIKFSHRQNQFFKICSLEAQNSLEFFFKWFFLSSDAWSSKLFKGNRDMWWKIIQFQNSSTIFLSSRTLTSLENLSASINLCMLT